MYEIYFYEDKRGKSPVEDFIMELDRKAPTSKNERIELKQIRFYIDILQRLGTRAGEPFVKHIQGDLWELRPGKNRILFFAWIENSFVLLHSFRKKTNKTPSGEIKKAEQEINDWIQRHS